MENMRNCQNTVMKHETFLNQHPVFTGKEFSRHLSSRGKVELRTQEAILAYYRKTERIVDIRRGLYAVVPFGSDPSSYQVDPFLVAAKLARDAMLSHHTALEFHGRAYSAHEQFIYSASRPLSPFIFQSHMFRGVKFPQALQRTGKEYFGVITEDRSGIDIRITNLERTMVDTLSRPDLCGGWEEIWRSLESVEFFDLEKVVEYVLLLCNATTAAKVGFFLDQHREYLMVEEQHLEKLRKNLPKQPHYIDRSIRKSGRFVPEWNLMVPEKVLERSWSEVL